MICWGGMTLSSFVRCIDHGLVRLEDLWDFRVLEVTGVAPYFLAIIVTVEDDVAMVIFAVSVIGYVSLFCRNGSGRGGWACQTTYCCPKYAISIVISHGEASMVAGSHHDFLLLVNLYSMYEFAGGIELSRDGRSLASPTPLDLQSSLT